MPKSIRADALPPNITRAIDTSEIVSRSDRGAPSLQNLAFQKAMISGQITHVPRSVRHQVKINHITNEFNVALILHILNNEPYPGIKELAKKGKWEGAVGSNSWPRRYEQHMVAMIIGREPGDSHYRKCANCQKVYKS